MKITYLNGEFIPIQEAKISVLDRGFLFGDGIYEVIPVYQKKPVGLTLHLDRLERSLSAIQIRFFYSLEKWISIFKHLIKLNQLDNQNFTFYLHVTRGADATRSHEFADNLTPSVMVLCKPLSCFSKQECETGFKAIIQPDIRRKNCYVKSINLLPNVIMYQRALQQGAIEAILIHNGEVVEACTSNIFIVKNQSMITPPQSPKILSGITRHILIELARQHNLPLIERPIQENELYDADEIWVTGSSKEICPITQIADCSIRAKKVGKIWHTMYGLYQSYKQAVEPLI
jgi:D-alanine transaminase